LDESLAVAFGMKVVLVSRIKRGNIPHHRVRFIMRSIMPDGTSLADFGVIPSGPGELDNATADALSSRFVIADQTLSSE